MRSPAFLVISLVTTNLFSGSFAASTVSTAPSTSAHQVSDVLSESIRLIKKVNETLRRVQAGIAPADEDATRGELLGQAGEFTKLTKLLSEVTADLPPATPVQGYSSFSTTATAGFEESPSSSSSMRSPSASEPTLNVGLASTKIIRSFAEEDTGIEEDIEAPVSNKRHLSSNEDGEQEGNITKASRREPVLQEATKASPTFASATGSSSFPKSTINLASIGIKPAHSLTGPEVLARLTARKNRLNRTPTYAPVGIGSPSNGGGSGQNLVSSSPVSSSPAMIPSSDNGDFCQIPVPTSYSFNPTFMVPGNGYGNFSQSVVPTSYPFNPTLMVPSNGYGNFSQSVVPTSYPASSPVTIPGHGNGNFGNSPLAGGRPDGMLFSSPQYSSSSMGVSSAPTSSHVISSSSVLSAGVAVDSSAVDQLSGLMGDAFKFMSRLFELTSITKPEDKGRVLNAPTSQSGQTLFELAVRSGNVQIFEILLSAELYCTTFANNENVLVWTIQNNRIEMFNRLSTHEAFRKGVNFMELGAALKTSQERK